ncbi:MAG: flagellar hook-associated protein 3 [Spirochaetes bacterium]|jgi:flagellar hook-associated protein 3 FlgL|nr:flagellar hook-associated protein 3 [Spirochaetota bacterium]
MYRVTNKMISNTMTNNLQRHKREMDQVQNSLATGKKVRVPRDNPIAASNQMQYQTRLSEVNQYITNIEESKSFLEQADSSLQSMTRIFHRIRVLAVQGANGIYSSFERKEAVATEINQLLEELVAIANTKDATGRSLFGGFETGSTENPNPFVPVYMTLTAGNQGDAMTGVEYRGDSGRLVREVAKSEYMEISAPGNYAMWASNQVVTSNFDATDYSSNVNQKIRIDGVELNIAPGDTIDIIIDKINNGGLSVRASKGGRNNLILETTAPHQMFLEDVGDGQVFKDIGMINPVKSQPPNNFAPTATIDGMSIFDMVIQLRDDLVRGDQELVGGRDLGMIDMGLENILKHLAETGAKQNRISELATRSEYMKTNVTEILAKTEGIDYTEEIMNFKWIESVHQYALSVGAKSIKPTLMDFLR